MAEYTMADLEYYNRLIEEAAAELDWIAIPRSSKSVIMRIC